MPGYGYGYGYPLGGASRQGAAWTPLELGSALKVWLKPESLSNPNLLIYTEDLTQSGTWQQDNGIVLSDQGSGVMSLTAGNTISSLYQSWAQVADDMDFVQAIDVKAGPGHNGTSRMELRLNYAGAPVQTFYVPTSEWVRINATGDVGAGNTPAGSRLYIFPDVDTGTQEILVRYPQAEMAAVPTDYQASTGGAGTAPGAIAQWDDSSGNGNHATMTTADYKPIVWLASALDGQSGMFSDNTNMSLELPDISALVDDWNIFAMCSIITYKSADMLLSAENPTGILYTSGKNSDFGIYDGTGSWKQFGYSGDNDRYELIHYSLQTPIKVFSNTEQELPQATGGPWNQTAMAGKPGAPIRIGMDSTPAPGGNPFNGTIHELIIVQGAMSEDDIASMGGYFIGEYPSAPWP